MQMFELGELEAWHSKMGVSCLKVIGPTVVESMKIGLLLCGKPFLLGGARVCHIVLEGPLQVPQV